MKEAVRRSTPVTSRVLMNNWTCSARFESSLNVLSTQATEEAHFHHFTLHFRQLMTQQGAEQWVFASPCSSCWRFLCKVMTDHTSTTRGWSWGQVRASRPSVQRKSLSLLCEIRKCSQPGSHKFSSNRPEADKPRVCLIMWCSSFSADSVHSQQTVRSF